ncbi:MAG: hypothetical protein ACXAB5_01440, partial [Candidatus Thorarchaeota archaeon]
MAEFRVGRGHDGPARVGEYILKDTTFTTPLLTSLGASSNFMIGSGTLGRDEPLSEEPMLVSLPFFSHIDELQLDRIRDCDAILLPSLLAFGSLTPDSPELILDYQSQALENLKSHIEPSRMLVRAPSEISPDSFSERISNFLKAGVSGAAFVFSGQQDSGQLRLRSRLPLSMMAVALGRIVPGMIPLLHYLGFDIIDVNYAQEAASQSIRLWRNGQELIEEGKQPRYCPCPTCSNIPENEEVRSNVLLEHNLDVYRTLLSESVHAMQSGRLRWLVESLTHNTPAMASNFLIVDRHLYQFIEEFTPSVGSETVPLIGPESYNSPVVR